MTKKKPLFRVTNTTYRKNCQRSSRGTEIDNLLRLSSWIRSPPSTATPPPQLNLTFCPAPLSKRAFIALSPETGQIDKEQQRITSCCLFLPLHQFNRAVLFNKTISIFRILLQVHNIFYLLFSLSHTFEYPFCSIIYTEIPIVLFFCHDSPQHSSSLSTFSARPSLAILLLLLLPLLYTWWITRGIKSVFRDHSFPGWFAGLAYPLSHGLLKSCHHVPSPVPSPRLTSPSSAGSG